MFHLSVGSLRHYEKAGLLKPEYIDAETGYRYYGSRQFECQQENAVVFLRKVGVGIAKERLENKQYDSYDMVFLILDKEDSYQGKTEEWPAETCIAIRFCGSHSEAPLHYEKIAGFIADHHMKINGFSKEITMIDYGITNDISQFVTEIQVPIAPM